jgi:hypothetical protein
MDERAEAAVPAEPERFDVRFQEYQYDDCITDFGRLAPA